MIKVGQWVNSYSKGIFRIEKILDRYYDEFDPIADPKKKVGDKYDHRIVITKRLLNSKFKKSISYESCSEFFIVPLDKEQKERLQEILKQNPNWLTELNDYLIPDINSIYNWSVQLDSPTEKTKVSEIIKLVEAGLTLRQIHDEIDKRGLTKNFDRNFGNYLFQMTNINHETVDKRYIWRNPKLIKT
ncbi:MAG: hypothetical protein JNK44_12415 [Cyclobacteriaceae bacterium]|nr:hypothetical protein [Cyclobacteriaceae bacterium]